MATETKTEYVTDVEHKPDCDGKRNHLYLYRQRGEVSPALVYSDSDGEYIGAGPWESDGDLAPVELGCDSCDAKRQVLIDKDDNVVAITRDNCPRSSLAYGHFTNYDRKPCEYCGYVRGGAS